MRELMGGQTLKSGQKCTILGDVINKGFKRSYTHTHHIIRSEFAYLINPFCYFSTQNALSLTVDLNCISFNKVFFSPNRSCFWQLLISFTFHMITSTNSTVECSLQFFLFFRRRKHLYNFESAKHMFNSA